MSKTRSSARRAHHSQAALAKETWRLLRKAVIDGLLPVSRDGNNEPEPLTVERAPAPIAPPRMARGQARNLVAQGQTRAMYEDCLQTYRSVVRAQDAALTVDNVGAAVAFYVAVNLHVLHAVDATAEMLLLLEHQLRGVTHRSSKWGSASIEERQFFFEQIAILSVFVAGSWANAKSQGPAAVASVQRAARGYLQQLLGLNPDLLTLGLDGLSVRDAEVRRAA
jgi:hypothetical protein